MDTTNFSQLLRARHTVRGFSAEQIPDNIMAEILEDARHIPSWSNTRPYVLAVSTGEQLARLSKLYCEAYDASIELREQGEVSQVNAALAKKGLPDGDYQTLRPYPEDLQPRSIAVGAQMYAHLGISRDDKNARDKQSRRNFEFFDAPAVLWFFVHEGMLPFSAMDVGLLLQTVIMSAKSRGIDSCALGTLATWRWPIDTEFVIPEQYKLITGLALGYANDDHLNDFRAEHPPVTMAAPKS